MPKGTNNEIIFSKKLATRGGLGWEYTGTMVKGRKPFSGGSCAVMFAEQNPTLTVL